MKSYSITSAALTVAMALGVAATTHAQQPASPVRVDEARLEPVQQLRQVTGNVRAVTRSRVAAVEPGHVIELNVSEGQVVEAGQRLAALDAGRLEIQLRQLQADLSVRQAILQEREAEVLLRESDLQLIQSMQQRGATNPKELSDAQLELSVAQARRDQAQRELEVKAAEADLLNRRIEDTVITAPFDGMVIGKLTELGEWVAAGSPVVELVSTGKFDVWLDVPQGMARAVSRENLSVMVHVDALDMTYDSQAVRFIRDVDSISRTFALVVRIDDLTPEQTASVTHEDLQGAVMKLAPGMSVTAWVPAEQRSEQLTVNKDAVLRNADGAFVYVVRSTGEDASQAVLVPVQVQYALPERFVVRSTSLSAGDQCIIEGNERLRPGAAVRVIAPSSPKLAEGANGQ